MRISTIWRTVFLLKSQTMICSLKHGMITGASLDAKKVEEAKQLEMEYYDKNACVR